MARQTAVLEKNPMIKTQTITREKVIKLVNEMPLDKLAIWYEYGLFVQSRPLVVIEGDEDLAAELAAWEAASDEDWQKLEAQLAET